MNCLILLLLLCCSGNNNNGCDRCENSDDRCSTRPEPPCGCPVRDSRFDCGRQRNDSCGDDLRRDRGFGSFPSPGNTCGCEEK